MDPQCHARPWQEVLKQPSRGDHFVQVYQDLSFLADTVAEYIGCGLKKGEAGLVIATPENLAAFRAALEAAGLRCDDLVAAGQLCLLDARQSLELFMREPGPDWPAFREHFGSAIAQLRRRFPEVRAYGEMVDVLWREGRRKDAVRLEEYWNELAKLQSFSLFCAYFLDNLDSREYAALGCVCTTHTHLIPARDYGAFNRSVLDASKRVLDEPLAHMLFSLSASHRPGTEMPMGQAILLWLQRNMPRTADRVLSAIRAAA